jgi:hypothetical protein
MVRRILAWLCSFFVSAEPAKPEPQRPPDMIQPLEDRQFLSFTLPAYVAPVDPPMERALIADLPAGPTFRSNIVGTWKGSMTVYGRATRVVLRIASAKDGVIRGEIKVPEQYRGWFPFKVRGGVNGRGEISVTYRDDSEDVRATLSGQVTKDGNRATGTFRVTQEGDRVRGTFQLKRV